MVILGAILSARAVAIDLELLRNGATRRVVLLLNHRLCGRDSAAEERSSVDPPELLAAVGAVVGLTNMSFGNVGSSPNYYMLLLVLLWLLRMWLEAEVAVVVDVGLRRKGLCDAFELWICVLR
ncbi:uncharacterized protein DS421_15g509120 [Arachis hypogaea]|nr:uncharacterized protein DS421_15g509120 [Arachis hypogaea]